MADDNDNKDITCVRPDGGGKYEVVKGVGIGANSGPEKSPELVAAEEALENAKKALENDKDGDKESLQQKVDAAQEELDRIVALEGAEIELTDNGEGEGEGNDNKGGGKSSNKNSKNSKGGALSFSELGSSPSATVPIKTHGGKSRKCKKGGKTRKNKKSTKKSTKKRCAKKCSKKRCAKKSSKK
jgi:hypothetical protein